jgi:hypothetical protein
MGLLGSGWVTGHRLDREEWWLWTLHHWLRDTLAKNVHGCDILSKITTHSWHGTYTLVFQNLRDIVALMLQQEGSKVGLGGAYQQAYLWQTKLPLH